MRVFTAVPVAVAKFLANKAKINGLPAFSIRVGTKYAHTFLDVESSSAAVALLYMSLVHMLLFVREPYRD